MYLPLHDRILSAIATALIMLGIGWALLFGLHVNPFRPADREAITAISVPVTPPPPERRPPPKAAKQAHVPSKPSPPNLRNKATPIVAPKPVVVLPVPPVVTVAPTPSTGLAANSGASDRAGNGQGAGGEGNGNGDGGGDVPPRLKHGKLSFSDLPPALRTPHFNHKVGVIYTVETDGHADNCRIAASSGITQLDQLTCSLIEQRFRFDPSRDGAGHKVAARLYETHSWEIETTQDRAEDDGR